MSAYPAMRRTSQMPSKVAKLRSPSSNSAGAPEDKRGKKMNVTSSATIKMSQTV